MPAILIRKEVATRWLSDSLLKTSYCCFPIISVRLGLEEEEGISESQFTLVTIQFYQIFFISFLPSLLYNLNTLNSLPFLPILSENKYNLLSVFCSKSLLTYSSSEFGSFWIECLAMAKHITVLISQSSYASVFHKTNVVLPEFSRPSKN